MHLSLSFVFLSLCVARVVLSLNIAKTSPWALRTTVTTTAVKSALFTSTTSSTMSSDIDENKKEEWTKARLHKTAAFRSVAILGAVTAAGLTTHSPLTLLSAQATTALHLLSFSTWFGTIMYTTFVLGITMFKNLPRQTFGKLQAKLFPKYFMLSSIMILLQLGTVKSLSSPAISVAKSTKALLVALGMTLLNQLLLEPVATENMMRRYELDDTPGGKGTDEYKKLKANFGKFHGISSLTNLIAVCAAVAHGFYISAALV